jgi:hypothetical protein
MRAFRESTNLREFKVADCRSALCDGIHQLDELPVQTLEEPSDGGGFIYGYWHDGCGGAAEEEEVVPWTDCLGAFTTWSGCGKLSVM